MGTNEKITIGDAAMLVGVTRSTMHRWVKDEQRFRYWRFTTNGPLYVLRSDIEAFVSQSEVSVPRRGR